MIKNCNGSNEINTYTVKYTFQNIQLDSKESKNGGPKKLLFRTQIFHKKRITNVCSLESPTQIADFSNFPGGRLTPWCLHHMKIGARTTWEKTSFHGV